MIRALILISVFLNCMLSGCSVKPVPINYGSDQCDFCSMAVVDHSHAAEIVLRTGKALKFDSAECMMNRLKKMDGLPEAELYLVNLFTAPGQLTDATKATFLKSPEIPSPMGANLSAFPDRKSAEAAVKDLSAAQIFDWEGLKLYFSGNIN